MLILAAALALIPQKVIMNAFMPGQREVVLGPLPYPDTMMLVIFEKELSPTFGGGQVLGGGLAEDTLGWIRWSVKPDKFAGKDCFQIRAEGELNEKIKKAPIQLKEVRNYWVTADGEILRQYDVQIGPYYKRVANSVYHKDSIDISIEDEKGRRTSTAYPNIEFSRLYAQFTPMMKNGEVVLREKEYFVFDPFSGKCDKHTARISGSAVGEEFRQKFIGKAFEIKGPELTQTAAVSLEGDLIRVELPKDRYIVMREIPPGKRAKSEAESINN